MKLFSFAISLLFGREEAKQKPLPEVARRGEI
jgi:hypothetical protein